jgi:hypothetical protein
MSAVSAQKRLARAWDFAAVHLAVTFSVLSGRVVPGFLRGGRYHARRRQAQRRCQGRLDKRHGRAPRGALDGRGVLRRDNHPEITFTADEPKINDNNVQLDVERAIKGVTKALGLKFVQAG